MDQEIKYFGVRCIYMILSLHVCSISWLCKSIDKHNLNAETNNGKAIQGLKAFKSQLRTDIIPDFVTRQLPKLVQEAPNVLKEVINKTPEISVTSFMENIKELSEEDIRKEIKSIFKTPEDLYSPPYTVLKTTQVHNML